MRVVRIALAVSFMLTSGATPTRAQAVHGGSVELAQLKKSRSATNKELGRARRQLRNAGCQRLFFRNRSGACRALRARVKQLERQLSRRGTRGGFGQVRSGYRTLCVRVCDGYYFSVSHISSRQRFAKDAGKCSGIYGPDEAVLFYHRFPHGDASQAVALDGRRYADQDYAFVFRERFVPRCAAKLQHGLTALRNRVFAAVPGLLDRSINKGPESETAHTTPFPIAWRSPSDDPETHANRAGEFVPRPIARAAAISETPLVRTVGDPYLFAETNAGPPATIAGYEPPVLEDFRVPQKASVLPALGVSAAGNLKPSRE
jgi:hypothetical protein